MGILRDWRNIPPNARQLQDYTGEAGFEEIQFTCGKRGRPPKGAEAVVFRSNEVPRLRRFIESGQHQSRPGVKVRVTGQKTFISARVHWSDNRALVVTDAGYVAAAVVMPNN